MYLIQKNPKYIIELSRPNELSSLFWCGKQDGWQPDEKNAKQFGKKDLNRQIWFFKHILYRDSKSVYVKAKPVQSNYNVFLYGGFLYNIKLTNGKVLKNVEYIYRTFPAKKCCQSKCVVHNGKYTNDIYIVYQFVHEAHTGVCLGEVDSITERKIEPKDEKK